MNKEELVNRTCVILVRHFANLVDYGDGFHTRIFEHVLHPEYDFVGVGMSQEAVKSEHRYPEHVVPCAVLVQETRRLIEGGKHSVEEIAQLLRKHWKVALLSREQSRYIDHHLHYKSSMPDGWDFETGDTFARLIAANIVLIEGH